MSQYLAQTNIMRYNQLYSFSWGGGMVSPHVHESPIRRTKKTNPVPLFASAIVSLFALPVFLLFFRRSVRGGHYAF